MRLDLIRVFMSMISLTAYQGRSTAKNMNEEKTIKNPAVCDHETGNCELPGGETKEASTSPTRTSDTLKAKEYSVLSGTPRVESEELLNKLTEKGELTKLTTKKGSNWERKNSK